MIITNLTLFCSSTSLGSCSSAGSGTLCCVSSCFSYICRVPAPVLALVLCSVLFLVLHSIVALDLYSVLALLLYSILALTLSPVPALLYL